MPRKKGERVLAIEKHFILDDEGLYKCLVEGCGLKIKCADNSGAPGRSSHLKAHKEVYDTIPAAEKRVVPQKKEAAPPLAPGQPEEPQQKKARKESENVGKKVLQDGEVAIDQARVVDYLARNLDRQMMCCTKD